LILGLRQDLSSRHVEEIQPHHGGYPDEVKFIVPYQRNPHFKGRGELLTKLQKKLCEIVPDQHNHRVALYGLGGVGKTQLALEYVYRHWQSKTYDRVYWISAVSQATLFTGLREIGVRAQCVPENTDLKPSDIAKSVLRWLNAQSDKWLFVIDNLDDITVVDEYLPDTAVEQHTLITTRNQHCDDIPAERLEVGILEINEAKQLLLSRAKLAGSVGQTPEGNGEAAEIVKELGRLPLAIEQAAAYIREASHDIFQFLPSYRNDRKFYHARMSKGNRTYPNSLANTWHLSFHQVQQNSHAAAELLRLLAFLNPDGVMIEFLERGIEGLTEELQALVADRKKFYDALAELTRFSLIGRQDEGSPRISIHRLVQSIIQDNMTPSECSVMTATVIKLCRFGFPDGDWDILELRQMGRRYQDQVVPPLRAIGGYIESVGMGDLLEDVGVFLLADGNYQDAIEVLAKAVRIMETLQGCEDSDTIRATGWLASAYWNQGDLNEAQKLEQKVLELRKRLLGKEHPKTLQTMGNLASTYGDQGKWEDAQNLQENVLELRKRLLGQEHPSTLTAMANVAATYRNQGKWDDAQKLEEKVLELRKKLLGQEHPVTLTSMSNLAATYWEQGKFDDAQKLEEKALESTKRLLGQEHPETLRAMANLAVTYGSLGKLDEAQALQEKVLEMSGRIMGQEHPMTLTAISNLASTYCDIGETSRSIELLEMAIEKQHRILGHEHHHTLNTKYELAYSYKADGRDGEAIALLQDTLEAQIRILGGEHPSTKDSADTLELWEGEAIAHLLSEQLRNRGEEHPSTKESVDTLGLWEERRGIIALQISLLNSRDQNGGRLGIRNSSLSQITTTSIRTRLWHSS
jgi:tetratricopeptide (TPR) repeat protein